ncbi:MAG TPA: alpha-1,4-glucan--maltose-1-phosphate maltosyltransferase [Dehalococcoidia bacterium]|nr:alpha-1,4-glucan--maltose-1-phosphate maltosyltransferase [Dehalococcoidia bacterium]
MSLPSEDRLRRVVITHVTPEIEGGRYAVKRVVGESVTVEADVFLDGHDHLACELQYLAPNSREWSAVRMDPLPNDRWRGSFTVLEQGRYRYRIEGWPDPFETWRADLKKRVEAGQDVAVELLVGAELVREAAARAEGPDRQRLLDRAGALEKDWDTTLRVSVGLEQALSELMARYPDRSRSTLYDAGQEVVVDRERARFSTWYEMFPRSASPDPSRPGTFDDVIARLPYVASMGFDVLYLPPIHPIGRTGRKGKNNSVVCFEDDPGSPWAIGSALGGHKAVHPELGTLADFQRLVAAARDHGIEIALDLAFQCSPDHPYVQEHPQWFAHRPDGSIRFAENPPKKYEDIYPLDFNTEDWQALWQELRSVVEFWIEQGVRIFRVDNPHTKPFAFWEWLIGSLKPKYPDLIFLSEAFTRPKVMYHLAKIGFTQSYTYFTWRNTKHELTEYFTELTQTEVREYFRPNLWPNTPDILHEYLQTGGKPAFIARLVLAATLGASYGIYGPAFELCINAPREEGSEEYLDSEKYEVKHWDLETSASLRHLIARVNKIRRENSELQSNAGLRFHNTDNEAIIAYSKSGRDGTILTVVNLDPHHTQSGWVELPLGDLGLDEHEAFMVHDLLADGRYTWHGAWNFVQLDPHVLPAHVFKVQRRLRSERDFDYYR